MITLEQLIAHHDRLFKEFVALTDHKPRDNIAGMAWEANYQQMTFHAQVLALLRNRVVELVEPPTVEEVTAIDKFLAGGADAKARKVSCPVCAAPIGSECDTPSGLSHIRRRRKAANVKR